MRTPYALMSVSQLITKRISRLNCGLVIRRPSKEVRELAELVCIKEPMLQSSYLYHRARYTVGSN